MSIDDTLMVNATDTDDDVDMDTSLDRRQSPVMWTSRKRDRDEGEESVSSFFFQIQVSNCYSCQFFCFPQTGKKPRVWRES
jgi:hypothetical protein